MYNNYIKETGSRIYWYAVNSKDYDKEYRDKLINVPCENNLPESEFLLSVASDNKKYFLNQARQQDLFNDDQLDLWSDCE